MFDKHVPLIEEAGKKGVQILCLQEIFNGPYFCPGQDTRWYDARRARARSDHGRDGEDRARSTRWWSWCRSTRRTCRACYYNTAAVFDADGTLPRQVPQEPHPAHVRLLGEVLLQARQPRLSGVPDALRQGRRVHLLRPPLPRGRARLGLNGAEIVFNPSATVAGLSQYLWKLEQPAHAVANGYFMGCINRVGTEAPWNIGKFYGSSYFVDPRGNFLAQASEDDDELVVAEMDLDMIEEVRRVWQFFRDRRPETYDDLVDAETLAERSRAAGRRRIAHDAPRPTSSPAATRIFHPGEECGEERWRMEALRRRAGRAPASRSSVAPHPFPNRQEYRVTLTRGDGARPALEIALDGGRAHAVAHASRRRARCGACGSSTAARSASRRATSRTFCEVEYAHASVQHRHPGAPRLRGRRRARVPGAAHRPAVHGGVARSACCTAASRRGRSTPRSARSTRSATWSACRRRGEDEGYTFWADEDGFVLESYEGLEPTSVDAAGGARARALSSALPKVRQLASIARASGA